MIRLQNRINAARFALPGARGNPRFNPAEMCSSLRNVHFIGLQSDARFGQLLSMADFHLLPQRGEAADLVLPSKLGSMFASGRPVVAMADPGTGIANEVEGAGLVVRAGDADAFAEALKTIAKNPDLRLTLGANARQRAEQEWNKTVILHSLECKLLTLCGQNGEAAVGQRPQSFSPP